MNTRRKIQEFGLPFLVNGNLVRGHSNKWGAALNLTLRFGEDRLSYSVGGICLVDVGIAIKSGYLNWTLTDCRLPEEDWMFNPEMPSTVTVQREETLTTETNFEQGAIKNSGNERSAGLSVGTLPRATVKAAKDSQSSNSRRKGENFTKKGSFEQIVYSIIARGTTTLPSWQIEAPPGEDILRGTILNNQRFARADITGEEPSLNVEFDIPQHGYVLFDENGSLTKTKNKWGLTRLLLKKHVLSKPRPIASLNLKTKGKEM